MDQRRFKREVAGLEPGQKRRHRKAVETFDLAVLIDRRHVIRDERFEHVDALDHGGPGMTAVATEIEPGHATVAVTTPVRNAGPASASARVTSRILDAQGREVARATSRFRAKPGGVAPVTQRLRITAPRLWQGRRDPYLYRVVSEVSSGAAEPDQVEVPLERL